MIQRRQFLKGTGSIILASAFPGLAGARSGFKNYPFSLGVASGYPSPDGFVLWTRLAPDPLIPGGGMPESIIPVTIEIARDDQFRKLVVQTKDYASPNWGHSIHAEIMGLEPDRWYWYRFHCKDATSPVGRARTAPLPDANNQRLRFAGCACQQYEQGYYAAYRHMLNDDLDLIVHLGDYIYESSWGKDHVRKHEGPEPITLDDYRARFARYKTDPDLQAAHAICPWLLIWDDHEVENDYAGSRSENNDEPAWFLARRAAAYKAYYEHMPLRRTMVPFGADMRIHTKVGFGQLIDFHMLDDRQYRSPQPCPKPGKGGSNHLEGCEERLNPALTMLGERQERWLEAGLLSSKSRWNLIGQQTLMAQADSKPGDGLKIYTDGWDGYPVARKRLLDFLGQAKPSNPVVLGGDVHSFWVTDLKPDFNDPASPVVASEFVCGSISSQCGSLETVETERQEGSAYIHHASGKQRGYARFEVTPEKIVADLRGLDDVRDRHSNCSTLSSWIVENGRPGPKSV